MANNWDRFQKINGTVRANNRDIVNSHFIIKGYPSIEIINLQDDSTLQSVVVNKEEQDIAYIYTYLKDPISLGSMWRAKQLHLLVTQEITVIKDVNWHKYKCLVCNMELDNMWGYFKGPEKTHVNLDLKKDVVLVSQSKPILVLPGCPLKFQDKIMIKGHAWIVEEYDNISDDGITYYSLSPTTMSKEIIEANIDKQVYIEEHEEHTLELPEDDTHTTEYEVAPNSIITLATEEGFFKYSNAAVKIKKHSASEVIFQIPFGLKELTIQYKEQGQIVERTYKIGY